MIGLHVHFVARGGDLHSAIVKSGCVYGTASYEKGRIRGNAVDQSGHQPDVQHHTHARPMYHPNHTANIMLGVAMHSTVLLLPWCCCTKRGRLANIFLLRMLA
jgi:hypothetical protein